MWVDSIMSHRVFAFPFPGVLNYGRVMLGACLCGVSVSVLKSFSRSFQFTELITTFLFQVYTLQAKFLCLI